MTIKKGDSVIIIAGKDKGKTGPIERVLATGRVAVTGLNIRKSHLKPSRTNPRGGIIEFAGPMSRSNVMIVCSHCSKPTRVKHTIEEDGTKYRTCLHCAGSLDTVKA